MIIGPFIEDLFWRGNTLFWSREGIVCRKATFEATIRSAAAVRLQSRPAVLIVLDKHGRLLYDDGKIVDLFLPGKVDKCWALKDGALVEGQGVWGLWDVVEGFKRLEMEQGRILHVDERIVYDAGDLVIGTIESTTKQRDTLDYDVTMHAGLARESHVGQAIVAKQRLPFRCVKTDGVFATDGTATMEIGGKRYAARDAVAVGGTLVLLGDDLVVQGQGVLSKPIPHIRALHRHRRGVVLDNGIEKVLYGMAPSVELADHLGALLQLLDGQHLSAVVEYLVKHRLGPFWVNQLPPDRAVPVLEAIRLCRMYPQTHDARFLYRIGRRDLARQAQRISHTRPARFADRRLEEVDRVMQTHAVRTIGDEEGLQIACRTMATTVGKGAYRYGTEPVDLSRALYIEAIETTVKTPTGLFRAPVEEWARFHNGVAAALAMDGSVDKSWIVFCKPAQLDPEYAGMLLGLGLKRQLDRLRTFDAFSLLESRHDHTTIGLLLGLAATRVGTKDDTLTKTLSLHTRAFLPMGSVDLCPSTSVQSAAMLGLGLTHLASRNLRMAKVALREVHGDEAYGFSSAMAVGLVMLGHGEMQMQHLFSTIHGPGAILATGLVYLKRGGDHIPMPDSPSALDNMPPESLLYRVYAQSLIRWDAEPSIEWVKRQVPSFIQDKDLGYMHIVTGACMAIGVKYAGTASEPALHTILMFYGILQRYAASNDISYEGKIRRRAARQAVDAVMIAMCAVMSGTGEIGVLRRIRIAHGQAHSNHMLYLALGLLFMGKGYYTLGATDLAVAAMTIAFFPRPGGYLEVYRHLWALAVEPRCLVAHDADTGRVENVPLKVVQDGREQKLMSPTLVCPFEQIIDIQVDSVRYWPVTARHPTIYVQKRAAFLDYASDNKGTRSIHARAGSLTGFDMHYDLVSTAAPPSIPDVVELVSQHTTDALLHGYARVFTGIGGDFGRAVLLECLVLDKPEALVAYHTLRRGDARGLIEYYRKVYPTLHRDRTLPLIRAPFIASRVNKGMRIPELPAKGDTVSVAMRLYEAVKGYERTTFSKTFDLIQAL